jgi:hypothetical protein
VYDYLSRGHRPEGVLCVAAGFLALSVTMIYRVVREVLR